MCFYSRTDTQTIFFKLTCLCVCCVSKTIPPLTKNHNWMLRETGSTFLEEGNTKEQGTTIGHETTITTVKGLHLYMQPSNMDS